MSDKTKRLAQEIRRNALKRMSRTGQGMNSQEEALLNFTEEQAKKRDLFETENRLYKPLDEVVNYICRFIQVNYRGDVIEKHPKGPNSLLLFFFTAVSSKIVDQVLVENPREGIEYYSDVVEKKLKRWGSIWLTTRDEVVFFNLRLDEDFVRHEKGWLGRQTVLDDLKAKLLRLFGDKPRNTEDRTREPEPPPMESDIFTFLDYRHEYRRVTGRKMTYEMLSKISPYSIGTFEQASRKWKNERGIT